MRRFLAVTLFAAVLLMAGLASEACAQFSISIGVPGIYVAPPVYVEPAPTVYVAPPPVYVAPRPRYYVAPRPHYYAPRPNYYRAPAPQHHGSGPHYHR